MRLAYITASFPFGRGESFLIPEIDALKAELDGVLYIVPLYPRSEHRSDWQPSDTSIVSLNGPLVSLPILITAVRTLVRHPARCIAAFKHILIFPVRHILKNCAVVPKALWLAEQVSKHDINHIHAHWGATTATLGMIVSEVTGVAWSLTCHRWDIYENNLLSAKSRSADFIRFISKRGLDDAVRLGVDPAKAIIGRMGVDRVWAQTPQSLGDRDPVIMCAANLIEVKGHRYLLQAISLVRQAGIPVVLKLAGEGHLHAELTALAQSLEQGPWVEFLGPVPHEALLGLYGNGAIDLFVLASIELSDGHHEGVPVSLMEAMSFGIPVISTRTGSIEELVDPELGLTVPDKDPAALADAIIGLLSQPERYRRLSQRMIDTIRSGWVVQNSVKATLSRMRASFDRDSMHERAGGRKRKRAISRARSARNNQGN
jgi:colanic acid/amylovoran biosynthesis glycosyltransferase